MKSIIRFPLLLKFGLPLLILFCSTLGICGAIILREQSGRRDSEMEQRMKNLSALMIEKLGKMDFTAIHQPSDAQKESYKAILSELKSGVAASGLAWIGISYIENDKFYYWVDSSETGIGYPFFYATPEHFASIHDGTPRIVRYSDEYGNWKGYVTPFAVKNSGGGETKVLLETSVNADTTLLVQGDTMKVVVLTLGGGTLFILVLGLFIARQIFHRPLRQLHQAGLRLAQGEFGAEVHYQANDELGDLARMFNEMSKRIALLHQERIERERIQREAEMENLRRQVGLAARISDKLNSPISTVMNTLDLLNRTLPGSENPDSSGVDVSQEVSYQKWRGRWDKAWSNLQLALREIIATSRALEEIRDQGAQIEATEAMDHVAGLATENHMK